MTEDQRRQIDGMSRYEMCKLWRFAEVGEPLLQGEAGDHFKERLFGVLGGFSPEISKSLGW